MSLFGGIDVKAEAPGTIILNARGPPPEAENAGALNGRFKPREWNIFIKEGAAKRVFGVVRAIDDAMPRARGGWTDREIEVRRIQCLSYRGLGYHGDTSHPACNGAKPVRGDDTVNTAEVGLGCLRISVAIVSSDRNAIPIPIK